MASPLTAPAAASTAASRSMPGRPGDRRPELDVMRALVVAGLVVFHSAMVFAVGTSWFVNDPRPSIGFSAFLLWGSLWGMPLVFLVSGMGVRCAMRTRTAWSVRRRAGWAGWGSRSPPAWCCSCRRCSILRSWRSRDPTSRRAVLARLPQCPGHRGRAPAAWALDLGRGRLRPRAPVVPLRAAGVLPGTAAAVRVSAWPARDAATPQAGRRASRPASAGHAGCGGGAGDRDRGGVRPRHQHRRLGAARLRVPVPPTGS